MGYLIGYVIVGVICGVICTAIAENRGMQGGFWWGFWLGIIGIIIVAVRPNDSPNYQAGSSSAYSSNNSYRSYYSNADREKEILAKGGWRCNNCGKVNFGYTYACECGCQKGSPTPARKESVALTLESPKGEKQSAADEIRKYKALVDDGIITQEEYEAKKKQLLGL